MVAFHHSADTPNPIMVCPRAQNQIYRNNVRAVSAGKEYYQVMYSFHVWFGQVVFGKLLRRAIVFQGFAVSIDVSSFGECGIVLQSHLPSLESHVHPARDEP